MTSPMPEFDGVLDVPVEDEQAYLRTSYREYLRTWRQLRRSLELARATGDIASEARFSRELRSMWPPPEAIAEAAGIVELDLERRQAAEDRGVQGA
jgi:hypothetical protein